MKKITFVIADLGAGGAQRVMNLLANDLAQQGEFSIDVISTSVPGQGSFYPYDPAIHIHYAAVPPSAGTLLSGVRVNMARVKALRASFKLIKPDIVVSFLTEINCLSLLAAVGTDIPVIVSERSDPYFYPEERLWRVMRRLVYPRAHMLVCQTEHAAGFFPSLSRKTVIYNPVSVAESNAPAPVTDPYILGVGRHSEEKGFDLLITAHALAHKQAPDLKLVLVGDGPDSDKLKTLAKTLGTESSVIFAGAQKDMAAYYRHAFAFVLPSRFEGMPNALLEAMAYGCPSLVTLRFKAAGEIVEDGQSGIILKDMSAEEMAERILYLYENPGRCGALGANAMENIGRFAPPKIYKQWRDLLGECL